MAAAWAAAVTAWAAPAAWKVVPTRGVWWRAHLRQGLCGAGGGELCWGEGEGVRRR